MQNGSNLLQSNQQFQQQQQTQQQFFPPKISVPVDYNINTTNTLSSTAHQPSTSINTSAVPSQVQQIQSSQLPTMVNVQQQQQQQLLQQQLQEQAQRQILQETQQEQVLQQLVPKVSAASAIRRNVTEPMVQSPYALPTSFRRSKDDKTAFNVRLKTIIKYI